MSFLYVKIFTKILKITWQAVTDQALLLVQSYVIARSEFISMKPQHSKLAEQIQTVAFYSSLIITRITLQIPPNG